MSSSETINTPFDLNDDEKIIIAKFSDYIKKSESCDILFSRFLNEREAYIAEYVLRHLGHTNYFFYGGENRERKIAAIYNRYNVYESDELKNAFPIILLQIDGSGYKHLRHQDYLGSVLALGLKRELIGDIVTDTDTRAFMFIHSDIANYLTVNYTSCGSDKVSIKIVEKSKFDTLPSDIKVKEIVDTLNSIRLDSIISSLTGKSREIAKDIIKSGAVSVNFAKITDNDYIPKTGDKLSVREYGRFLFKSVSEPNKKNKLKIIVEKYIT